MSLPERIADKIQRDPSGCWLWTGSLDLAGYGQIRHGGRTRSAHRVVYALSGHELVDGLVIDHVCRNRSCVNPGHLRQVTQHENIMCSPITVPAINAARTHCTQGHEFTSENTRLRIYNGRTKRQCRACSREAVRALRARRQFADAGRADSSFLLYVTVVLAAVFVAALTKPGQALAVLGLAVTVGVVLRHVLAAHYRGVARVESARHRGVIR